jgi:hypothetical protein
VTPNVLRDIMAFGPDNDTAGTPVLAPVMIAKSKKKELDKERSDEALVVPDDIIAELTRSYIHRPPPNECPVT